ncbi:MAG: hypothetical protein IJU79_06995 [Desulfovibrionaceae bacterium]|nr:hypothetical protein [Desulfovibrionaceae bacterium]
MKTEHKDKEKYQAEEHKQFIYAEKSDLEKVVHDILKKYAKSLEKLKDA